MNMIREKVSSATLELLKVHAEKLNKKINKLDLNLSPVSVSVVDTHTKIDPNDPMGIRIQTSYDVSIDAPDVRAVVKPGYEALALAQAADEGDVQSTGTPRIITRIQGSDESINLDAFRADRIGCQECGTIRRRNTVIILRNKETGSIFPVGTDCAEKYVPRASNLVDILEYLTAFESLSGSDEGEDGYGGYYQGRTSYDLDAILTMSAVWTGAHGYVRSTEPDSTKNTLLTILWGKSKYDRETQKEYKEIFNTSNMDAIQKEIEEIKEWVENLPGRSDYENNLKSSFDIGIVTDRTFGIVISSVPVYRRNKERESLRKEETKNKPNADSYFGTVGEKFGRTKGQERPVGTVKTVSPHEGYYGTTYRTIVVLDSGETLLWWASSQPDFNRDDRVSVAATVKAHQEYNGRKQTIITRATLNAVK